MSLCTIVHRSKIEALRSQGEREEMTKHRELKKKEHHKKRYLVGHEGREGPGKSTPPERQLAQDTRFLGIRRRAGHSLPATTEADGAACDEEKQEGGEGDPEACAQHSMLASSLN